MNSISYLTGRNLLQRAEHVVSQAELPERHSAAIGALALLIIQIARTSPGDQAEQCAAIAALMRE
jgi:hypothetical protein